MSDNEVSHPVAERWTELYDNAKTWEARCFAAQKNLTYVEAQLAHARDYIRQLEAAAAVVSLLEKDSDQ